MKLRTLLPEDYPSFDHLMQQLHQIHVEGRPDLYLPVEHPYSHAEYLRMLTNENPRTIAVCAEEKGHIVGICTATLRPKSGMVNLPTAYLNELVVDSAYQHMGIAKILFQEIQRLCKESGAVRLDLMVWEFNKNAREMYEHLGMTPQRYIYEKEL